MKKEIIFNGKKLSVLISSDADESVFHEIFTERDYQKIEPQIKNAQTLIVDIGAHIGLFSLYASALNPNVKILSCEPEEENFKNLKENLKQNHIQNVTPKNLAVAGKEGTATLYISEDSHNHSLDKNAKGIQSVPDDNHHLSQKVQTTTLEKILRDYTTCDLVKMDCEGAEFEIVASTSPETLKKIKRFFIEYHEYTEGNSAQTIKQTLEKNNFKAQIIPSRHDKRMGMIDAATHTSSAP
jgi:FkbM family methyltransferase